MSDSYLEAPMAEQDPLLSNSSSSSSSNSELPGSEERQDGGEKKRRLDDVSEESGSRRPRILQSAIAAVVRPQSVGGGGVVGREEQQQGHAPKAAAIAALQEAQTKPEAVSRNKRMLSSLLGHLGQAKRNLERDSSVIERQATRAAAAIERNRTDSERVNKLNADKSKEEASLRNAAIASQRKADVSASGTLWSRQVRASQHCYFTETAPRLAWLPGLADEDFKALFDENKRRREVDALVQSREAEDARRITEIDAELAHNAGSSGDAGALGRGGEGEGEGPVNSNDNNENNCSNNNTGGDSEEQSGSVGAGAREDDADQRDEVSANINES